MGIFFKFFFFCYHLILIFFCLFQTRVFICFTIIFIQAVGLVSVCTSYNIRWCLRYTHTQSVRAEWGFTSVFSSHDSRSRGLTIFFNKNFEFKIDETSLDPFGNFVITDLKLSTNRLTLVSICGPIKDEPNFYENLAQQIRKFKNKDITMVGGWNLLLRWSQL